MVLIGAGWRSKKRLNVDPREVEADAVVAFGQIAETVDGADGPLIRHMHGAFDPAIRC